MAKDGTLSGEQRTGRYSALEQMAPRNSPLQEFRSVESVIVHPIPSIEPGIELRDDRSFAQASIPPSKTERKLCAKTGIFSKNLARKSYAEAYSCFIATENRAAPLLGKEPRFDWERTLSSPAEECRVARAPRGQQWTNSLKLNIL